MAEFICLANTVIDAHYQDAKDALDELKKKWVTRFGKDAMAYYFPVTKKPVDIPVARGLCQAWRFLLPSASMENAKENNGLTTLVLPLL
ncbi:UNVERIFIED_CONTAM: hypothetical protein Sindi_0064100 [Sesamum indicum]